MNDNIFHFRTFLIIGLIVIHAPLFAQQFKFENLPSENALSANSVYALLRDSEGFLWIGTQNGLNRYDGERYTSFLHTPADSATLSDNFILSLAEDSLGNIWVGTRRGLNRFDKQTQKFQRIHLSDISRSSIYEAITSLACSHNGEVYAAGMGSLFVIAPSEQHQIQRFGAKDLVAHVSIDAENNIVVGKLGTIQIIGSSGESVEYAIGANEIIKTTLHVRNTLFVGTEKGLLIIQHEAEGKKKILKHIHILKNISVFAIEIDAKGRLWVGTDTGIYIFSGGNFEEHLHIKAHASIPDGLHSANIRVLMNDRTGTMWIGMLISGVQRYDPFKESFTTIGKNVLRNSEVVWSILQDKTDALWIGAHNGVYTFDSSDTRFRYPGKMFQQTFANTLVTTVKEDHSGNIWIGTRTDTLYRYSPLTQTLKKFHLNNKTITRNMIGISDVYESKSGVLWLTTTNGLFSFDRKKNEFRKAEMNDFGANQFNHYFIYVTEDADTILWISSTLGLYRYNPNNGFTKLFQSDVNDAATISFNVISSCFEDSKQRLWVTTLGGGFNLFDRTTETFTRFNSSNGLVNDVVYGMLEDSFGRLWMSTDDGIACFNPETQKIFSVGKEEGLEFVEFAQNSFHKNSSGTMFFGGIGGMVMFQPESIRTNAGNEPIVATDIRINYQSVSPDDHAIVRGTITSPQEIHLTPEQQALSIDFVSLNFRHTQKTKYSYRLLGFYPQWVYPANRQRTAHYTHLSPGEYLFEVRSSVQPNDWSEREEKMFRIKIVVHPPFWRTWWFVMVSSFCVLGMVVAGVRYISQRKLKEQLRLAEHQRQIQSERERISRELHDSTGANLAAILAGLNVAEKHLDFSKVKTKRTLRSLTSDARLGMSQLRETIWAMKTNAMSVQKFSDAVCESILRQVKYHKNLNVSVNAKGSCETELTPMQTLNLFRIIQEATTNVLKHAAAKNIFITIDAQKEHLDIIVENDGGAKKKRDESLLQGNGISNMERRAKELGAAFSIELNELTKQNGCRISVRVPYGKR